MSKEMNEIVKHLEKPRCFIRVYALPTKLTNGYCFGSGQPIMFINVDWFEHVLDDKDTLITFIQGKVYYRPDARYLVLGDVPEYQFTLNW